MSRGGRSKVGCIVKVELWECVLSGTYVLIRPMMMMKQLVLLYHNQRGRNCSKSLDSDPLIWITSVFFELDVKSKEFKVDPSVM